MSKKEEKNVYELFDDFFNTFIIEKKSFLTEENNILTIGNLTLLKEIFIDNSIGKNDDMADEIRAEKGNDYISFKDKIFKQFDSIDRDNIKKIKDLFANLLWLRNLPIGKRSIKKDTKINDIKEYIDKEYHSNIQFYEDGIAGYGQLNLKKYEDIAALIFLFIELLEKKGINRIYKKDIISLIMEICHIDNPQNNISSEMFYHNNNKNNNDIIIERKNNIIKKFYKTPIINIILNLLDEVHYEAIASYSDKERIRDSFKELIDSKNNDFNNQMLNEDIYKIREELISTSKYKDGFSYYNKKLLQYWNFDGIKTNEGFTELDALQYKKQIILYGPPGTSKTYKAKELAKVLIIQKHNQIKGIKKTLALKDEDIDKHINNLQLHQNYSYEEFIIGMRIEENKTEYKKGFLLKLIDKINDENKINEENRDIYIENLPYVLILDEINRVDLSGLLGEAFSAIENRDEEIKLSALKADGTPYTIKIPENLYIIGTMNQIDFSLEQIDFALRRRFTWYFYGYDKYRLEEIIKSIDENFLNNEQLTEFIDRATELNNEIAKNEEFGKEWQIGHTFFAEIIKIAETMNKKILYVKSKKTENKLTKAKEPVIVLWNISIKPMLESYCGNMDKDLKKSELKKFENIFLKN